MTFEYWWRSHKWPNSYVGPIEMNLARAAWNEATSMAQTNAQQPHGETN